MLSPIICLSVLIIGVKGVVNQGGLFEKDILDPQKYSDVVYIEFYDKSVTGLRLNNTHVLAYYSWNFGETSDIRIRYGNTNREIARVTFVKSVRSVYIIPSSLCGGFLYVFETYSTMAEGSHSKLTLFNETEGNVRKIKGIVVGWGGYGLTTHQPQKYLNYEIETIIPNKECGITNTSKFFNETYHFCTRPEPLVPYPYVQGPTMQDLGAPFIIDNHVVGLFCYGTAETYSQVRYFIRASKIIEILQTCDYYGIPKNESGSDQSGKGKGKEEIAEGGKIIKTERISGGNSSKTEENVIQETKENTTVTNNKDSTTGISKNKTGSGRSHKEKAKSQKDSEKIKKTKPIPESKTKENNKEDPLLKSSTNSTTAISKNETESDKSHKEKTKEEIVEGEKTNKTGRITGGRSNKTNESNKEDIIIKSSTNSTSVITKNETESDKSHEKKNREEIVEGEQIKKTEHTSGGSDSKTKESIIQETKENSTIRSNEDGTTTISKTVADSDKTHKEKRKSKIGKDGERIKKIKRTSGSSDNKPDGNIIQKTKENTTNENQDSTTGISKNQISSDKSLKEKRKTEIAEGEKIRETEPTPAASGSKTIENIIENTKENTTIQNNKAATITDKAVGSSTTADAKNNQQTDLNATSANVNSTIKTPTTTNITVLGNSTTKATTPNEDQTNARDNQQATVISDKIANARLASQNDGNTTTV